MSSSSTSEQGNATTFTDDPTATPTEYFTSLPSRWETIGLIFSVLCIGARLLPRHDLPRHPSTTIHPFFRSEHRKRPLVAVYCMDKGLCTFLGRPPRIVKRFINTDPPVDVPLETVMGGDSDAVVVGVASTGWNKRGVFTRGSYTRVVEVSLTDYLQGEELVRSVEEICSQQRKSAIPFQQGYAASAAQRTSSATQRRVKSRCVCIWDLSAGEKDLLQPSNPPLDLSPSDFDFDLDLALASSASFPPVDPTLFYDSPADSLTGSALSSLSDTCYDQDQILGYPDLSCANLIPVPGADSDAIASLLSSPDLSESLNLFPSPGVQSVPDPSHHPSTQSQPNPQTQMPSISSSTSPFVTTSRAEPAPKEPPNRVKKRELNTLAARRYRQRRLDRMSELEAELEAVKRERDELKMRVSKLEGETDALRSMVKVQDKQ
ncbi:hypothetical protein BO70DRAFT_395058 [Aspergillus heteromorphus CBS 117.55]|uniref:BZIP domain-containing protein n=1 Tax=Aspergillus heteromorphus CBS 117.55 TaxID=1448321 RepID=A0A317WIP8_9EURO|nr:uncharacterized protein BO70DRAFT_395058 [Aspergillus heteromorphus CBS 117.55]PWY85925.1 hypothetical protein BO70DRAFT_395058 [Aspergillus heteromorphus CBS 117.55]